MIRLTLALTLSIYAGLLIFGEPAPQAVAAASPDAGTAGAAPAASGSAQPMILTATAAAPGVTRATAPQLVVPSAAALAAAAPEPAVRLIGEPELVSLMPEAAAPVERIGLEAVAAEQGGTEGLLRVAGDRVNMRSGPSTANGVVQSLPGGTLAEPIGAPEGGWQRIRVPETGVEGFMSARFLEPA